MWHPHGASTCRWAQPTIFLAHPIWLDACDKPWTCLHDDVPRPLDSTDVCATCSRWESRAVADDLNVGDTGPHRRMPPFFLDIFVP